MTTNGVQASDIIRVKRDTKSHCEGHYISMTHETSSWFILPPQKELVATFLVTKLTQNPKRFVESAQEQERESYPAQHIERVSRKRASSSVQDEDTYPREEDHSEVPRGRRTIHTTHDDDAVPTEKKGLRRSKRHKSD